MKKLLYLLPPLLLFALSLISCDGGNGNITGPGYNIDLQPVDSQTVPNEIVMINCFVTDLYGHQIGGIVLNFQALDSGYISSERISSATDPTGLTTDLYFDPKGDTGNCRIVVTSPDLASMIIDTATIAVLPYNLEFYLQWDTMVVNTSNPITCRLKNPITGLQTGNVNIDFIALDKGEIVPDVWIRSDANTPSGLQSGVVYQASYGDTGINRIAANALYTGTIIKIMGTDTTYVNVIQ